AVGYRRDHGRRELRGIGQDPARADGGGDVGWSQHPEELYQASAAYGGKRAFREAAPSRAGDGGPAIDGAPHGRPLRRAPRTGNDRRLSPAEVAADRPPPARARRQVGRSRGSSGRGTRDP